MRHLSFRNRAASKTTTTRAVSPISRKICHIITTTNATSTSFVSKRTSHSLLSTSSSRTGVALKFGSAPSRASFLTSISLTTTGSFHPNPTDSSYRLLGLWPFMCEDESALSGHAPINAEHQRILSSIICHDITPKHDITSMNSQSKASTNSMSPDWANYFYSIRWVDGRGQWLTSKAFSLQ
jgi:hypothetical protein